MERIPLNLIQNIPPVTRAWALSAVVTSILVDLKLVSIQQIWLNSPGLIFKNYQVWRMFTCFCYFGGFDINLIIFVYYITQYSSKLEEGFNRSVDYLWFFTVNLVIILNLNYILGINSYGLYGNFLVDSLVYIWSKRNSDLQVRFLGFFEINASYLPIISFLLNLTKTRNGVKYEIVGYAAGHIVYYLSDVLSKFTGVEILKPIWDWNWR